MQQLHPNPFRWHRYVRLYLVCQEAGSQVRAQRQEGEIRKGRECVGINITFSALPTACSGLLVLSTDAVFLFLFIYLFFFLLFCFRLGCEPASRWLVVHAARRKGELLEPGCLGAVEGGAVGGGQAESLAIQNIW